jgi:group II intron reverse transcriptase/maturase
MKAEVKLRLPAAVWAAQLPLRECWYRAEANGGMPGVDGVSTRAFARNAAAYLGDLTRQLAGGRYLPWPLRLAKIEKKDGGVRRLMVPALADRIVQSAVAQWLAVHWEKRFDDASHGYRPGRGVSTALRQLRRFHEQGYSWILDADIRAFFDSIPHGPLVESVREAAPADAPWLHWLRHWLAGPVWDGERLWSLPKGIPQGSPLSPLLANCYLHKFDGELRRAGLGFIRYADDFLVVAKTPFELPEIRERVGAALGALGLELSPEKTRFTSFDKHFRFLGAEMQGRQIFLPFEKEKAGKTPMEVACAMPAALRCEYRRQVREPGKALGEIYPPYQPAPAPAAVTPEPAPRPARTSTLDALRRRPDRD